MNKNKIIIVCLFVPVFAFTALSLVKIKNKHDFQQKVILARQINAVLRSLMIDLSQIKESNILDVPADGDWHDRVAFTKNGQGIFEYLIKDKYLFRNGNAQSLMIADDIGSLRIRRQEQTPYILELQIVAQNSVTLTSNLKIRVRE